MTRINVIPPEFMLDEWVAAHLRESLRPINKLREGKYAKKPLAGEYRLKTGHELWGAYHGEFVSNMWAHYKKEWVARGKNGFNFDPSLVNYPKQYCNSYTPTKKDLRHNLARLCERFRNRTRAYHFNGKAIDTVKEFREYLKWVKQGVGVL